LWPTFIYMNVSKFLQTQHITKPSMIVTALMTAISPLLYWLFIQKLEMGFEGAGPAFALTQLLKLVLFLSLIYWQKLHVYAWSGWSRKCLEHWGQYLRLALPGAVMICGEWWSVDMLSIAAGWLGQEPLSVQSVLTSIILMTFCTPTAFSTAATNFVGKSLGENDPERARRAGEVVTCMGTCYNVVLAFIVLLAPGPFVGLLTKDEGVGNATFALIPFISCYIVLDTLQTILGGILRGCGKQLIVACCNIGAYVAIGLPIAFYLSFWSSFRMGLVGLWIGNGVATFVQALIGFCAVWKINWTVEAEKVVKELDRERAQKASILNLEAHNRLQEQQQEKEAAAADAYALLY